MISGTIKIPGDKSVSHRAALFSALKEGPSVFSNFNLNNDCAETLSCLGKMGIRHHLDKDKLTVWGKKISDWEKPGKPLYAGNSGTTARLISGILAGLPFSTKLTGDASLSKRPMQRVIDPLTLMGATIESNESYLPLTFNPVKELTAIDYKLPMSSAQVKSAVLLAGLNTRAVTTVTESKITRDHTERMLNLKSTAEETSKKIFVSKDNEIPELSMEIPGDFSSAAFFISAALLIPGSDLLISNVSLNPTRIGYYHLLKNMGADIEFETVREKPEPIGTMRIRFSRLTNLQVSSGIIPNIIDEIPILAIVASQSRGSCVVRNASELRYKESDRINTIVSNLRTLGIDLTEFDDGFAIEGPQQIKGGEVLTHGDHRIAMAFTIAGLLSKTKIVIDDPQCAAVSFPEFYDILREVQK